MPPGSAYLPFKYPSRMRRRMAFEPEEAPRRRRRARSPSDAQESQWPSKDEPLSWALLPPEERGAGDEEAEEAPPKGTAGKPSEAAAEEDWKTRYQYLMADFDNYRRRVQKETEGAVASARGRLLRRVIDLHDGIERALEALPAEARAMKEGHAMVMRNFDALLKDEGAEPVAQEAGRFQPDLHEAIGQVPTRPGLPEGTVGTVVQQGYRGPAGLLRPAKVLVASADAAALAKAGTPRAG